MSNGYERAVMFEMLRLIAYEPIYVMKECEYSEDGKRWQKMCIERYLEVNPHLTPKEKIHLEHMRYVKEVAENPELCEALFEVSSHILCSCSVRYIV